MDIWELLVGLFVGLLGGGGIVGIWYKSRLDELRETKERLNTERRNVYAKLMDPYILLFAKIVRGEKTDEVIQQILSDDYRRSMFEFTLLGSDEVVKAYTDMMEHFYKVEESGQQDTKKTMDLWGNLRLQIRKDLGNKDTKLLGLDMLKSEIKDLYKLNKG